MEFFLKNSCLAHGGHAEVYIREIKQTTMHSKGHEYVTPKQNSNTLDPSIAKHDSTNFGNMKRFKQAFKVGSHVYLQKI